LQYSGPVPSRAPRLVVLEQSADSDPKIWKPAVVESDIGNTNAWLFTQSSWLM
jgi:hypothetical protein